ncbi:MAG: hypothetical protein K2J41_08730 [Eubacterium sp.]|nr:hypothetical protein [Eubacterium sp.]
MFPTFLAEVATPSSLASLDSLISGIKSAIAWIFGLFGRVVNTIASNDLLLYPVLLCIVISAVGLVIGIAKKFGLRPRRS